MKRLKKLKVLVSLLAMFSLFSLTNVSATEGKDKNLNKYVSEIKEEKEQENEKDNLKKEETNKKKDNNINLNEEQDDICTPKSLPYVKRNEEQKGNQEYNKNDNFSGKKTTRSKIEKSEEKQEKNKVNENNEEFNESSMDYMSSKDEAEQFYFTGKTVIAEEELKDLSKKFLVNYMNVDFDNVFENIMNCFGYRGKKQRLKLGFPYISVEPFSYKHNALYDSKKNFIFNSNWLEDLVLDFKEKSSSLEKCFGSFDIFGNYYQYCFKEGLNSPVLIFNSYGKGYDVDNEMLNKHFELFYNNLKECNYEEKYKNNFMELIKMFLTQAYLKTFFIRSYGKHYDFYSNNGNVRGILSKFSKIFSDAFECEFDEYGNLKGFNLNFSNAIKNDEDAKFLKRLYDAILKEGGSRTEDKLLYDLYMATVAFLKNTEFWNKMLRIIVYANGYTAKSYGFNYDLLDEKSISKDYFKLYGKAFEMEPVFELMKEENDALDVCNKNIIDYDFKDLHERFKYNFLALSLCRKKAFLNNAGINIEEKFNNEENCVEKFSEIDDHIKKSLEDYFRERFLYSFKMPLSFKWLKKFFENNTYLFDKDFKNVWFQLARNDDFRVSNKVMFEYLDRAVKNERIREECLALVRYLFVMYLTEGFIAVHGNKSDVTNVSILRLVEFFSNILDLQFVKNESGNFMLKLGFKKADLNYNAQIINRVVENIKNEESWKKATEEDKMIYRLYSSAIAFIKEQDFWNKFLAVLVCDHGIDVAKNFCSDVKELYDEYKNINKELLYDSFFSNTNNYLTNTTDISFNDFLYYDFYNLNEKEILNITKNLTDFSKFVKIGTHKSVQADSIFVNYILDKCYYNINDERYFHEKKPFNEIFFAINNDRQNLLERLGNNFAVLNAFLYGNCVEDTITDIINYGVTSKHFYLFTGQLKSLLKNLCLNFFKYIKKQDINISFGDVKQFDRDYFGDILKNKKIVNEYVPIIERFFCYYINKLVFGQNVCNMFFPINRYMYNSDKITELRDNKVKSLKNIAKPMLEWYLRMFNARVEDGNIKFKFDLKYIDDKIDSNIKTFLRGFERYNGQMNNLKIDNLFNIETNYENKLPRFFYNLHTDAFAFLNSEDFWNKYMSKMLFLNLIKCIRNKDKINNNDIRLTPFTLQKEFVNVSEKIKRENINKYEKLLQFIKEGEVKIRNKNTKN